MTTAFIASSTQTQDPESLIFPLSSYTHAVGGEVTNSAATVAKSLTYAACGPPIYC